MAFSTAAEDKMLITLKGLIATSFRSSVGIKTVLVYCYVNDMKQRLITISVWAQFKQSLMDMAID